MKDSTVLDHDGLDERCEAIFQENYIHIFKYVIKRVQDKEAAEDITQETFMVAWKSITKLLPHENIQAWLINTAKYVISSYNRMEKKHERALNTLRETRFVDASTEQDGRGLFSDLDPADAKILTLFYIDRMSTREIAKSLGTKEPAVRTRLFRARQRLEKKLGANNILKKFIDRCNILMFF